MSSLSRALQGTRLIDPAAQVGPQGINMQPFIYALHLAFIAGVVASAVWAVVSLMRGAHRSYEVAG